MSGRHAAGLVHVGIQRERREILCLQIRHSLHLHIAIAIKREMRNEIQLPPVGDIDVLRLRRAQIVAVEIALLQHFSDLQMHPRSRRHMQMESEDTGLILAEIEHRLPGRRVNQLLHRQLVLHHHRKRQAVLQCPLRCLRQHRLFRGHRRERVIPLLAVVYVGEDQIRACHFPALIRSDHLFRAVRIRDMQLRDEFCPALEVRNRIRCEPEPAVVPAIAEHHGQHAAPAARDPLYLIRHIVRDHLEPRVIVRAVRRQILIADFISVKGRLIQPGSGNIQPRTCHSPACCRPDLLREDRMPRLLRVLRGNPLSRPGLIHFARLEEMLPADRLLRRTIHLAVRPDRHRPHIPRPRRERHSHRRSQTVLRLPSRVGSSLPLPGAAVHLLHYNPGRRLLRPRRVLHHPVKDRRLSIGKPQRLIQMIHLTMRNLHT